MGIFEIIDILRNHPNHPLWSKPKPKFNLSDYVELNNLKTGYKKQAYGKGTDKRVMRISDGTIYANGKECFEANVINRSTFYHLIGGRTKKFCDFKYIE